MNRDMGREGYGNPNLDSFEGLYGKLVTPENEKEMPVNDVKISGTVEEIFNHIKTREKETGHSMTCAKIIETAKDDKAGTIAATYETLPKNINHKFETWGFKPEEYEPYLYNLNRAS